jgi:hypothetical protein
MVASSRVRIFRALDFKFLCRNIFLEKRSTHQIPEQAWTDIQLYIKNIVL